MGRTRTNIRQRTAQQFGLQTFRSATSTAGATTTATDVDELGQFVDDELIGFWYYNAAGHNAGSALSHRITDNAQSTGVVTFIPGDPGVSGAQAYEILPFSALSIHRAIDQALLMLYDEGVLVRKFWTHAVSGSPIYNADMSYWTSSGALHGWTAAGTVTRRQQAASKWIGESVARLNNNLTLDANWARFLTDQAPGSIRLHAWLNAAASGTNRVSILENGSSVANSGNHEGDSDWHVVSTESTALTDGETDISVQIQVASQTDLSLIWIESNAYPDLHPISAALYPDGPSEIFYSPLSWDEANARTRILPHNARPAASFEYLKYHDEAADVEMGVIKWLRKPPAQQLLWIVGNGPFTLPTTDSGIIEIGETEELLVAKVAALVLMESHPKSGDQNWANRAGRLARDIERLSAGHGDAASVASLGPNW